MGSSLKIMGLDRMSVNKGLSCTSLVMDHEVMVSTRLGQLGLLKSDNR